MKSKTLNKPNKSTFLSLEEVTFPFLVFCSTCPWKLKHCSFICFCFCFVFLFWGFLCISLTQKCRLQTMNYFRVFGGLLFRNISNGQLLHKMLLYAIFVEHLIKLAPRWNRLTMVWWVRQCSGVLLCHIKELF